MEIGQTEGRPRVMSGSELTSGECPLVGRREDVMKWQRLIGGAAALALGLAACADENRGSGSRMGVPAMPQRYDHRRC